MKNLSKLQFCLVSIAASTAALSAAPLAQFGNGASLHALGSVEMVYQDNLFLTPSSKQHDLILSITPGLELKMAREGAASVNLKYEHIFELYDKYSELDSDMSRLNLGVRYDSGVVLATLNASYQEYSQTGLDTLAGITSRPGRSIDRDVINVGGNLKYGLSRLTSMSVGASYSDTDYADSIYTDSESWSVPVTLFYKIRPTIDLTAGVRYREVEAASSVGSQDYRDMYYYVGAVGELFSPVIFADLSVGIQDRKYKNLGFSIDTPTYSLSLIYTGDPKTTISATIRRDYRIASVELGTYTSTIATLAAQYAVSNRLAVSSSINFGKNDYQRSPRKEDLFVFTLGATYRANDMLSVAAGYEYHDVDGNLGFNSYDVNKLKISASLRY